MKSRITRLFGRLSALTAIVATGVVGASCGSQASLPTGPSSFLVTVTAVNGGPLPAADAPLPPNRGDHDDTWDFTVEARDINGALTDFNGPLRVSVVPGAVLNISNATDGAHASGRNIQLAHGKGGGTATLTATYGPARLWVQDLGYYPAPAGQIPQCANGVDDNGNVAIDFPADPGCAFPDDATEDGGTYTAGASQIINYQLPTIVDVQGQASTTPYPNDAVEIDTSAPHVLVVTRVSSDGFYVTDLDPASVALGYNHLFAFNFSTPSDMRPCDIVTYLAGTANDFFGFTELNFPSYELTFPIAGTGTCLIPDPDPILPATTLDPIAMEKLESGLVRIQSGRIGETFPHNPHMGSYTQVTWTMPSHFGPDSPANPTGGYVMTTNASNCDLNGDGVVDYTRADEGGCSLACDNDYDCSEWNSFTARGEIKLRGEYFTYDKATGAMGTHQLAVIQVNLNAVPDYDPSAHRGLGTADSPHGDILDSVTGTLRDFSGGSLNWTIEARCSDDLVCHAAPAQPDATGCQSTIKPIDQACITLRTIDDNDASTN